IEMPRETQETTAAMRRVVADQIKALNELTEIVTRSGRAVDVVEAAQPRRPAPAERPTIERPVAPAPRPQPAPQAAQPAPQPAPRPAAPAPQREAAPQQSGSRG